MVVRINYGMRLFVLLVDKRCRSIRMVMGMIRRIFGVGRSLFKVVSENSLFIRFVNGRDCVLVLVKEVRYYLSMYKVGSDVVNMVVCYCFDVWFFGVSIMIKRFISMVYRVIMWVR